MGKLTDLLKAPAAPTKESLERLRARLEEMDALLDEVYFLRVENAELRAIIKRYEEDRKA